MSEVTIHDTIARWHRFLAGDLPGGLDELLADDVVFFSPIVFRPQEGKEITALYLTAAGVTLAGKGTERNDRPDGRFRYTKQVLADDTAVLEFETNLDGKYVNGVDIIRIGVDGRIVEFRVMIRPLQAVNAVHAAMQAMLDTLAP